VDEGFGVVVEEVGLGADGLEPEVDVGPGLVDGEGFEMGPDADALGEVQEVRRTEVLIEGVLTGEEDFDFGDFVKARGDEESQVGETVLGDEVSLIEDDEGGLIVSFGMVEDLKEEAFFAPGRRFLTEGIEDELEEALSSDLSDVDVDGQELGSIEAFDKEPEGGGLADAGGPGEGRDGAEAGKELQPGEGLRDAVVSEEVIGRGWFCEGLSGHVEVVSEHGTRPPLKNDPGSFSGADRGPG
jgi:hypothetical protein